MSDTRSSSEYGTNSDAGLRADHVRGLETELAFLERQPTPNKARIAQVKEQLDEYSKEPKQPKKQTAAAPPEPSTAADRDASAEKSAETPAPAKKAAPAKKSAAPAKKAAAKKAAVKAPAKKA